MRTIAKLGAVLVTAVTLLATWAWAGPGNGKSEQWVGIPVAFVWPDWPVPPLNNELVTMKMGGTMWVNEKTAPDGTAKGYAMKWDVEDGSVTRQATGKIYLLKKNASQTEIGHGDNPYAYWPDVPPPFNNWGIVVCRWVFEAEDGEQLILKVKAPFANVDGVLVDRKQVVMEWSLK